MHEALRNLNQIIPTEPTGPLLPERAESLDLLTHEAAEILKGMDPSSTKAQRIRESVTANAGKLGVVQQSHNRRPQQFRVVSRL